MGVFDTPRPIRVRIDTDSALNVDAVVPCVVAVYPDPADPRKISFFSRVQNDTQAAALVTAVMRYAIAAGIMGEAMRMLSTEPTEISNVQQHQPKPPGTPKDDLPPHLRG